MRTGEYTRTYIAQVVHARTQTNVFINMEQRRPALTERGLDQRWRRIRSVLTGLSIARPFQRRNTCLLFTTIRKLHVYDVGDGVYGGWKAVEEVLFFMNLSTAVVEARRVPTRTGRCDGRRRNVRTRQRSVADGITRNTRR